MTSAATTLKEEGNAFLAQRNYSEAHAKYTEAIEIASGKDTAVLYCNRAQACLLLKRWDDARYDAADALVADPNYHKAWLRLGRAYDGMKNYRASLRAYSIGCHQSKSNAPLMRALDDATRESRKSQRDTSNLMPPCEPQSDPARAALSLRLKEEGNALFTSQPNDPRACFDASIKFTLALAFDRSSAAIYCNRAHLCLLQELWDEAIEDSEMAIHIDENYLEAYWFLATAYLGAKQLVQGLESITTAYRRILTLTGPFSPADEELHDNILSLKNEVEARLRRAAGLQANQTDAPWILAQEALRARGEWYTSAWTMTGAYKDFSTGVALLYQTKTSSGSELLSGQYGAMFQRMAQGLPEGGSMLMRSATSQAETIELMTNGLLTDLRSFHFPHQDFKQRVTNAILFESQVLATFREKEPRALVRAVNSRLRQTNGWDATPARPVSTRKSVSITVRIWLMQAILAWKIDEDHKGACTLFSAAIDFLELGRREWENVTREFRGVIFETTFLLIVARAYLECCVERFTTRPRTNLAASGYSTLLKTIKDAADKILLTISQVPQSEKTPLPNSNLTDCITYIVYPEAVAHDAVALYYREKANGSTSDDEKQMLLSKAIEYLTKSIALYPTDDDLRCEALYHLIDCIFQTHQPLAIILPFCEELAVSVLKSRDIWRASALSSGDAPQRWESYLSFAMKVKHGIMRKQFKRQDVITPASLAAATKEEA